MRAGFDVRYFRNELPVPDVRGLSARAAMRKLMQFGLNARMDGDGFVTIVFSNQRATTQVGVNSTTGTFDAPAVPGFYAARHRVSDHCHQPHDKAHPVGQKPARLRQRHAQPSLAEPHLRQNHVHGHPADSKQPEHWLRIGSIPPPALHWPPEPELPTNPTPWCRP